MAGSVIAFVGGGNMARSLIGALRANDAVGTIRVSEPDEQARAALAREFGVEVYARNAEAAAGAAIVVLAVKPQVMSLITRELAPLAQSQQSLWISIAAGIRMDQLDAGLGGGQAIVRAMPNTPALIGAGVTGLVANAHVKDAQRDAAEAILRGAGQTVWIDSEALMDAVTAVSGSGPAYFLLLMECLERAAVAQGLPQSTARILVLQTALGAARMAVASDESPHALRQRVTSPGGTTAAAIEAFEGGGFDALVSAAVVAATLRGVEMAKAMAD